MLKPGFLIDEKYRIIRLLGSGSFGNVYLAENIRCGRKWAVKEIPKTRKAGVGFDEIFQNETEALKKLNHRNLASIADCFETEDSYLILTDYLEGVTLDHFREQYSLQTGKGPGVHQIMTIALELCDAIRYLQENEMVHGDIKPSNVIITKDGKPVLIDFGGAVSGYAKTERKQLLWTPGYSPPEAKWGKAGYSRDVYSFGAVLYRLITGESPDGETYLLGEGEIVKKWLKSFNSRRFANGKDKRCISSLSKVILRCLNPEPVRRYPNASSLYTDLVIAIQGKNGAEEGTSINYPFAVLILIFVFSAVSVCGGKVKTVMTNKAYESCLSEAKHCVREEAAQFYRLAIMLEPFKKEGYIGLIDTLSFDNELSGEDDDVLTKAMNAVEYDRGISNEESLKTNEDDYFDVAYRFGITYYYCFSDLQKTAALKYLSNAAETTFRNEEDSVREEQKKKSDVLVRMIRYGNTIGVPDRRGENEVTYTAYWNDMKELLNETPEMGEADLTYLWVCQDVLNRILNDADAFLKEGISLNELEQETGKISDRIHASENNSGIQSEKLKKQIKELLPVVFGKLEAVSFTERSRTEEANDRESS